MSAIIHNLKPLSTSSALYKLFLSHHSIQFVFSMGPKNPFAAPKQPPAANPFDPTYAPVDTEDASNDFINPSNLTTSSSANNGNNPFALYDDVVDDDGAETGRWESEPTGTRSEPKFWQPRFYASYFDINVSDLATRLFRSIIPCKPLLGWVDSDEETEGGTSVPDLYGPVWITTTLVLALSMGAEMATFLRNVFQKQETSVMPSISSLQFSKLWRAASVLYFYVFIFPVLLTVFQCLFAKRSLSQNSVRAHPIVGTVMVYGYSMTPVVIASFVATIPIETVQIAAMGSAFTIGALVIMLNLWRDVSVQHKGLTYFVRLLAAAAHVGVGTALVFIFFIR